MLQIQTIRENKEEIIQRLSVKNYDGKEIIEQIIELDNARRKLQKELEEVLNQANQLAKQVGDLFKSGKQAEANELKNKSVSLKENAKAFEEKLTAIEAQQTTLLLQIPNTPSVKVPKGKTPADNENVFQEGEIPELPTDAKPHWELTSQYDLIDFELGVKLTGAGFPVYKGKGAKLQRALIQFFLDNATAAGYTEIQPPILVNEASGFGTGQLPDKEGQMYFVGLDKLYLIPTAEVPITNIYRDVILKTEQLPIKNCGYTPCFRREAGSYGKDVRGLNRLHQFDKVEIVQVVHPDKSYETLEAMRNYVAGLLQKLELPYRILKLCGGDMSFASALTYDFETFSAAQKKWLEVSSVSNFETFQSNRLKLRIKHGDEKPQLAHTLNGSALALPRIVASLLENNQTPEGIKIPKALIPYTGFEIIN
ncbi:MAG: serine--tRNA ligase [Bacteroidia bacterium]